MLHNPALSNVSIYCTKWMKTLFTLVLFLTFSFANAQYVLPKGFWATIVVDSEGNYLLCSRTKPNAGNGELMLTKLSSKGQLLWSKTFKNTTGKRILFAEEEGSKYNIVATSKNTKEKEGLLFFQVDKNGKQLQNILHHELELDPNSAIRLKDGSTVVSGYTTHAHVSGYKLHDIALSGFDTNGQLLWSKKYETKNDTEIRQMEAAPNGGFLLKTLSNVYSDTVAIDQLFSKTPDEKFAVVQQFDGKGNVQWSKTIAKYYSPQRVLSITSGVLVGNEISKGYFESDLEFIKLNEQGDTLWKKVWSGAKARYRIQFMKETADGDFLVAGQEVRTVYCSQSEASYENGFMLRMSKSGSVEWSKKDMKTSISAMQKSGSVYYAKCKTGAGSSVNKTDGKFDVLRNQSQALLAQFNEQGKMNWSKPLSDYNIYYIDRIIPLKNEQCLLLARNLKGETCLTAIDRNGNAIF
jgi:hypothetical protein